MHVVLVSSSSGSLGGGEQYVARLAEGLARRNVTVSTWMSTHSRMDELASQCSRYGEVLRVPYCNTYDRIMRSAGSVLSRSTIAEIGGMFRRSKVEVIHINKQNVEDGLDLMLAARNGGLPTVATVHIARSMAQLQSRFGRLRDWVASSVLEKSDAEYITVARHCRNQLKEACPRIDVNRIHSVWNGVASSEAGDRGAIRKEWDCGPETIVLGCVGRLEQQKNPLFALDLLKVLPASVKLVWVGDGRLRESFQLHVRRLGLENRVVLEGWRSDARSRMAGFDVFLLPSLYEGFPFAILEAMAAQLPCVVSDVDGNREAIDEGKNGFLCPVNDVTTWRNRVTPLIESASCREQMGAASYQRFERDFSLDAMARGTIEVYEKAIARAESARR